MRVRASIILPLLFLVVTITVIVLGFQYPIEAAASPWVIGGGATILLFVQVLRETLAKVKPKSQEETEAVAYSGRQYLEAGLWLSCLLIPVYLVGISIGLPLYTFMYQKLHREGWILSIASAVAVFVLVYFFFGGLLRVYLYKGILLG